MTISELPPTPASTTTTLEDIVFWIAVAVTIAFLSFTLIDFGEITLSLRSTKSELVTAQKNLGAVNQQIREAQKELDDTPATIEQARQTLAGLENDITKKRDELKQAETDLNQQIADAKKQAEQDTAELNSQIEVRKGELKRLEDSISARNREISEFDAKKREFCRAVRVALHAGPQIVNSVRPAAEYCGFPLPGNVEHPPG